MERDKGKPSSECDCQLRVSPYPIAPSYNHVASMLYHIAPLMERDTGKNLQNAIVS